MSRGPRVEPETTEGCDVPTRARYLRLLVLGEVGARVQEGSSLQETSRGTARCPTLSELCLGLTAIASQRGGKERDLGSRGEPQTQPRAV